MNPPNQPHKSKKQLGFDKSLPPICGQRFKDVLNVKGYSEPDFAKKYHVSRNTIALIVNGGEVKESTIKSICEFLKIDRSDIEVQSRYPVDPAFIIYPPDEWLLTDDIRQPVNTDNGLTIRVAKLEHQNLDRFGRGKFYELVHVDREKREDFSERVLRHARVCERIKNLDIVSQSRIAANYTIRKVENNSGWWIVDHWIDGPSLRESLKKDSEVWSASKIKWLGIELLEAIRTLHQVDVILRELNPNSIFICGSGIKLSDFELAQFEQGTISISGDWESESVYRAPEVDDRVRNFQSDFYSWGRIMSFALTGDPRDKEPKQLANYPKAASVIKKCHRPSFSDRPNSIDAILSDWNSWKPVN
ncbi:MAG: protein kinase [Pirellulaceae bacterium]|nr:protein kinase [Pirellulaceae bacterium]